MKVSRKAKEALVELVWELGMGQVFVGLLRDPTHLENHWPGYQGAVSIEHLLRPLVGEEIALIVLPLSYSQAARGPESREAP